MKKTNFSHALMLNLVVSGSAFLGATAASAQDAFYIEHKPTDMRINSCATTDGATVSSTSPSDTSECAQWIRVANGDYFYLQNVSSGKFIRPAGREDGVNIELRPNTWLGNFTQWSYEDRGDGHGHLVNRATGKHIFLSASGDLQQQPAAWRGNFTRWQFVSVGGVAQPTPDPVPPTPNPATPTPSPVADFVGISNTAQFGDFLIGGQDSSQPGFTLYTFANDNGGPNSNCNGQCAVVWPPLTINSASALDDIQGLGTTTRNDGSLQVTYNNEPLYFYNQDNAPGDTNGHNAGNVWFVAQISGGVTPPTPGPQTPAPSTPDPLPTCSPGPAVTDTYEAESGTILGSASVFDDGAASGGQGVAFISTQNAGFRITTTRGAASSFVIRYASELSGAISYRINQVDSGNASFNSTGAWVGSYSEVTVNTSIPAGATIDIFYDGGDSAMNVDNIAVTSSGCDNGNAPPTPGPSTPGPAPSTPAPGDTPTPPPSDGEFGFESNGLIWFANKPEYPTSGSFFNCRDNDNDCFPSTFNAELDRWEHVHSNLGQGQTYTAQLKVPGLNADQFPRHTYTWNFPSIGNNPAPGGNPGPGPGQGPGPDPSCTGLDCLDWTTISLISGKGAGPGPRPNDPGELATPTNGANPTAFGFAFDLDGSTFTWRWGGQIVKGGGDSGLQVWCSNDDGLTYSSANFSGGTATAPCSGNFDYFFRYLHPSHSLNNNPAHQWIYTGPFTTEGPRVNPNGYTPFTDGSSNWMRFRHPIAHDGTTAAVLNAQHNNDLLRNLDRYNIWVDDSPGNTQFNIEVSGNVIRNEAMRNSAGGPNGQQFFAVNQNPGFGGAFSYGQVIQFEISAVAGRSGAQTYNDFSYYTVGLGWGNYGDKRLQSAGKAGTTMILSDGGTYSNLEYNATFTQPLTTLHSEEDMDDFIVGHHLFHGVDPNAPPRTADFDVIKIGERTCGDCHFRDGRGSEVIQTAIGPRLPPPIYGTGLLLAIEGREVGLAWDGRDDNMEDRVRDALRDDHGVDANDLPGRVFELLVHYTEVITVPDRNPIATDDPQINAGHDAFMEAGCGDCHTPVQRTTSTNDAYDNLTIRPYTDMKLWDLGEGPFRTAPLWGLGHNITILERNGRELLFMHDGSSRSVDEAVQRHGGSAAASRAAYNSGNAAAIDAYVRSL